MSPFMIFTSSPNCLATSFKIGETALQGPHHLQKNQSTGFLLATISLKSATAILNFTYLQLHPCIKLIGSQKPQIDRFFLMLYRFHVLF